MKAVVMSGPGDVRVEEIAPPVRRPGEALLRVRYVGLCGSDLNSYRGRNPLVSFPRIPGHEVAATVVEIDGGHPQFAVGTSVTLSPYTSCGKCAACINGRNNACQFNQTLGVQRDGALTEFISIPVQKLYAANLGLQELCMVEPLTVGSHAISRARVTEADTVAVFGCGGVGLGAVAASAFRGGRTIAIDIDNSKLEIARLAGAQNTINSHSRDIGALLAELTQNLGPQVVIEAVGAPETFRSAVELVSYTGRVVYIGYAKQPVTYDTKLFVQKEIDILGTRNALDRDFQEVIDLIEQGRFPVNSAISTVVGLDDAPEVLRAWDANPSHFTKVMISVG